MSSNEPGASAADNPALSRVRPWALAVILAIVALSLIWTSHLSLKNWLAAQLGHRPLLAVNLWHYQLDRISESLDKLAANPSDLLVIDHAKSSGKVPLDRQDVQRLKNRPGARPRLVVAYMSIGEAEEFRYYWQSQWKTAPPPWLGEENCAWPQAHRVRFWLDGWKDLTIRGPQAFLRRIIEAGFDGVYLDRVDIFETFLKERPEARQEMIAFVAELAATARALKPGFLVIPQNAESLLSDQSYRATIDAIAKESLFYGGSTTGQRTPPADFDVSRQLVARLLAERKPVFLVEYLVKESDITRVRHEILQQGFLPTFPTRSLDGEDPTAPRDLKNEVGTPERTHAACAPGQSW